jgi:hypothetical protein
VPTLAAIAPAFIAEICDALASDVGTMQTEQTEGLGASLAIQVASCVIERCTYDPSVNCGYIYVVRPRSAHYPTIGAPHSGTVAFLHIGFNIDVDVEGQLTGVELLDRSDIFLLLREARAL